MSRLSPLSQFGRYEILRLVGEGGMGAVYLARDSRLERQVALKIPTFRGSESGELSERFYREAEAAAALRHPNICPIYDVDEIDGTPYIAMAYIEGQPLSAYVRADRPLPERMAAAIVRKLALALDNAHREGVIHRDLKPANVMIDSRREPLIMDFGLARRIDRPGDTRKTKAGMLLGTPAYMSPEQVNSDTEAVGPATDLYSLGVVLYELLTGEPPFDGPPIAVIAQIQTQEPQPPGTRRPGLNARLEAICLRMMAKRVADRYPSMRHAADEIGSYLRDRSGAGVANPVSTAAVVDNELELQGAAASRAVVDSAGSAALRPSHLRRLSGTWQRVPKRWRWSAVILAAAVLAMGGGLTSPVAVVRRACILVRGTISR